eukprot:CAMPEP_0113955260 /NCGR_PEP_ID=MMETSP0011_2-20120614/1190_1 /TAXON_ID=101924 /ORGANISM="Rhodosorus marinus" /LENGTH=291 /DNA_ID=CAMNT_0000964841 /DNA_START=202 /DNA_END=1076 /DNA_ORIENTATION=+ /assembly_acc=CAM_ASM_000156
MESLTAGVVIWEREDSDGNRLWRPYGPILNAELELAYGTSAPGWKTVIEYSALGKTRRIDVEDLKDSSVNDGGRESRVRRAVTQVPEWFWDDGVTWVRYSEEEREKLEKALSDGETSAVLTIGRWRYEVNFCEGLFFQKNLSVGTIRPVLRVDFSEMYGPSPFEVGILEEVLNVQQEEVTVSTPDTSLSFSDDEDNLLVSADATLADACILCLDEFDDEKPAMRLRDCHGHFFHRNCDMHTNILHVIKLMGHCPVCQKSYRDSHKEGEILSPVTPNFSGGNQVLASQEACV